MKILTILPVFCLVMLNAYGHGGTSETFPPVDLFGRQASLEVSSSSDDPDTKQISISLIDFDSKTALKDVRFAVYSERGDDFIFEREFDADDGFLVFNFISQDADQITLKENDGGLLGLLGLESRLIDIKGPDLAGGGLYKLKISIIAADGYDNLLAEPLVFNAGISIPQTTTHRIDDPDFGAQDIDVITYYDQISDFGYDPDLKELSYKMPFEWTRENINQTSIVHMELSIPKTFGDLLSSGFIMNINGVDLPKDIVNIDDFIERDRVVHFIVYQKALLDVLENGHNNGMNFKIRPSLYHHLSSVTENGQFRILVSWEPRDLKSGSGAVIKFDITDVFLKNKPVSAAYDLSITHDGVVVYQQSGSSTDSRDQHTVAEFMIPDDVSGITYLNFENLDGNPLARTAVPVIVDRAQAIPDWIRNNASWWSSSQIDDETFIKAIRHLIRNGIIKIPPIQPDSQSSAIPDWIRNNASWWSSSQIDDETFVQGLEFLLRTGVIRT